MPRSSDKRQRLEAAAAELVMTRGLDGATIAAIAERAGVPTGSVFYYLRTKEDVAAAAVESLAAQRAHGIAEWSQQDTPQSRLTAYLSAIVDAAPAIVAGGSVSTLAAQLRESAPAAAAQTAEVIRGTVAWAAGQYEELGFSTEAANARALHLVTGIEGASHLAYAIADRTPIDREGAHLTRWVANAKTSA